MHQLFVHALSPGECEHNNYYIFHYLWKGLNLGNVAAGERTFVIGIKVYEPWPMHMWGTLMLNSRVIKYTH